MAEDLPELNKVLGPLFTLDVSPFSVDTSVPLPVMHTVEVGVRGSSLNPQGGYVRRFDNGAPSAFFGNNNDLYVDLDNYDLYQKIGTTWTIIGNIEGPQGIQGIEGIQGIQGIQGVDGLSAYEVAVADGFVGDEAAWLASLIGATGATGATGAAGSNGTNGTNGTDGADGASAYDVAVAEGFVGDEAAWLASLIGATGATGATGSAGADFPAKSIVTKTGAYTLTNTEFAGNVLIKANSGSAFALTLNTGLTGVEPCNVMQYGAGQITISGSATLRYAVGPKTRTQYSTISIIPLGSDEYLILGDATA